MKNLSKTKNELKDLITQKRLGFVLKSISEILPSTSPKKNTLIALENDFKYYKISKLQGLLSHDDDMLHLARLRKRVMDLIDNLEESDFDKTTRHSRLSSDHKIRKGHILYRIPNEMQLNKETRCLVRIAFDKAMILEDLDLDDPDLALKPDLRISDYMRVEIKDPLAEPVFEIRTTSKEIQFLDEDDFTEWRFYVKPLQAGQHSLELKVSVIQRINGEDHVREKTLDESVIIIAGESTYAEETYSWKKDEDSLGIVIPYRIDTPISKSYQILKGGRAKTLSLVLLVCISGMVYASPFLIEYARWILLDDTVQAYTSFIEDFPESKRVEEAAYKRIIVIDKANNQGNKELETALAFYVDKYGKNGKYITFVLEKMTKLNSQSPSSKIDKKVGNNNNIEAIKEENIQEESKKIITSETDTVNDKKEELKKVITSETDTIRGKKEETPSLTNNDTTNVGTHEINAPFPDKDNDKIRDKLDNCPDVFNPDQLNSDFDPWGDACDECKTRMGFDKKNNGCPVAEVKAISPEMVKIKGGTFEMRNFRYHNFSSDDRTLPFYSITLNDYYIGRYEVTYDEYKLFRTAMGEEVFNKKTKYVFNNDNNEENGRLPVRSITWSEAISYCIWLSEHEGLTPVYSINFINGVANIKIDMTANGYRLPTEAEWEFAASERGKKVLLLDEGSIVDSTITTFYDGYYFEDLRKKDYDYTDELRAVDNSNNFNNLGLYNMGANISEWCFYSEQYFLDYDKKKHNSPNYIKDIDKYVYRGGNILDGLKADIWYRGYTDDRDPISINSSRGFRLARSL